jgi:hypothetical protein
MQERCIKINYNVMKFTFICFLRAKTVRCVSYPIEILEQFRFDMFIIIIF